jgi:aryl-alcohol dehydrogenase-like predicted oxidoreductase
MRALHRAVDLGVNFIDTADVYGNGRSERLVGQLLRGRPERIYVATKAGRGAEPHTEANYAPERLREFVERSLRNLKTEAIDLLQLHCPPNSVYYNPDVFASLERLVEEGKIRHYGVSVETVEQGLKAMDYPNLQSVQIIFNIFRQRPAELFLQEAARRKVGVLARVPLASGLLTGRLSRETSFPRNDHRNFNRDGKYFDRGETFAGVDLETGLEAVEQLRAIVPEGWTLAQFALRWILMFDGVTCAIPGAKRASQVEENVGASELPPLSDAQMERVREIYELWVKPQVHWRW